MSSARDGQAANARVWLCWLLALFFVPAAWAHKPSDSYLTLHVVENDVRGQWDIALRDLEFAIGIDDNQDGAITWGELRGRHREIAAYALARLALSAAGQSCPMRVIEQLVDDHSDGAYSVLRFAATCPTAPASLRVDYRLFFDLDAQHRGLLRVEHGEQNHSAIFSAQTARQEIQLSETRALAQFLDYTAHGIWHIWIGYDHLLFLFSLLLPAVLVRSGRRWSAAECFRHAMWDVLRVVTAFTVAHSITLSLAALEVVLLPARWVEAAIAASVIVVALNNLLAGGANRWLLALAFGLIHGFGFASVLTDLGLPRDSLLLSLIAFNLGVELGQLALVAAFLPVAWSIRQQPIYQRGVLAVGSLLVVAIATIWLVERAFDWKLLA